MLTRFPNGMKAAGDYDTLPNGLKSSAFIYLFDAGEAFTCGGVPAVTILKSWMQKPLPPGVVSIT